MKKLLLLLALLVANLLAACAPMTVPNNNQPGAQASATPLPKPTDAPTPTPTLPPSGSVGQDFIGTEWRLVSLNAAAPVGSLPVTLIFRNETELGGSGGCNGYFGAYTLAGETFTASGLGSTMMACGEEGVMEQESAFFQLLSEGGLLARMGDELTITTASGVLKFERIVPPPPAALEGTLWRLEAFGTAEAVSSLLANTEITAVFKDGSVGGFGGCNNYSGPFNVAGNTIKIKTLAITEMWCSPDEVSQQEQTFTAALMAITSYAIEGDTLTLTHPGGTLIFRAMPEISGVTWKLKALEGGTLIASDGDGEITATFAEGHVTGFAGCNQYFGEYTLENGRLTVSNMGATKKFCEGAMDLEQSFLASLQKTNNVVATENQLKLINDNGELVFEAAK